MGEASGIPRHSGTIPRRLRQLLVSAWPLGRGPAPDRARGPPIPRRTRSSFPASPTAGCPARFPRGQIGQVLDLRLVVRPALDDTPFTRGMLNCLMKSISTRAGAISSITLVAMAVVPWSGGKTSPCPISWAARRGIVFLTTAKRTSAARHRRRSSRSPRPSSPESRPDIPLSPSPGSRGCPRPVGPLGPDQLALGLFGVHHGSGAFPSLQTCCALCATRSPRPGAAPQRAGIA